MEWHDTPCTPKPDHWTSVRRWYTETFGWIEPNVWVLHYCNNGWCRNPEHIYLGSPSDNSTYREQTGRGIGTLGMPQDDKWKIANALGHSQATEDQVRIIRSSDKPIKVLVKELGLTYKIVWSIKTRRTWRHV